MAGVVTCNRDYIVKQIAFTINAVGNGLSPIDYLLLFRAIKTLTPCMDRRQTTSSLVAEYLHSLGFHVNYFGLDGHSGREIHGQIADRNGAVLSFETGRKSLSENIVAGTRLWGISVNSLISMPCVISHASIDAATRAARGLPEDLIRLCVGIEDPRDLLEDLERALLSAEAIEFNEVQNRYVRIVKPEGIDPIAQAT